jgi:hypothetical protein
VSRYRGQRCLGTGASVDEGIEPFSSEQDAPDPRNADRYEKTSCYEPFQRPLSDPQELGSLVLGEKSYASGRRRR